MQKRGREKTVNAKECKGIRNAERDHLTGDENWKVIGIPRLGETMKKMIHDCR